MLAHRQQERPAGHPPALEVPHRKGQRHQVEDVDPEPGIERGGAAGVAGGILQRHVAEGAAGGDEAHSVHRRGGPLQVVHHGGGITEAEVVDAPAEIELQEPEPRRREALERAIRIALGRALDGDVADRGESGRVEERGAGIAVERHARAPEAGGTDRDGQGEDERCQRRLGLARQAGGQQQREQRPPRRPVDQRILSTA